MLARLLKRQLAHRPELRLIPVHSAVLQKLQQYQKQVMPTVLLRGRGAEHRLQQQSLSAQTARLHQVRRQLYQAVTQKLQRVPRQERELI